VIVNKNHTVTLHKLNFVAKEKQSQARININLPCLFYFLFLTLFV